jgi:hypothetical protein
MVDCGSGPYAGPQSASLGEEKTIANQTVQLNAKPPNHPFPTPRSGFVQLVMDASLCSLSFFMILTIFQTFSFVHNDLTQVNPKILNQETLHRFVYQ